MEGRFKVLGVAIALLLFWAGWSYLLERRQHQFAQAVTDTIKIVPGARLIGSYKSGDLVDPISWFWPPTTQLTYDRPDVQAPVLRFYIMSFHYGEDPAVWLVEPDCKSRTEVSYFPDAKDQKGEPARNVLGEPLKAPNGSIYRRYDTGVAASEDDMRQLCDTDWTAERRAAATPPGNQSSSSS